MLRGATLAGQGLLDVVIDGALIVAVCSTPDTACEARASDTVVDVTGKWLAPAFIDSHVHLMLDQRPREFAAAGVAAVVDLGAPVEFFAAERGPLDAIGSGPMLTAPGGYPLRSWGVDRYGVECDGPDQAIRIVDDLAARGAGVIKLTVTSAPTLDDVTLKAAVARAHDHDLRVAAHALGDGDALRAGRAGADVLAHTPSEPLSESALELWGERAVITTLRAFGTIDACIANLRALRARGAIVLYGSDFGNTPVAGINGMELRAMQEAGMDGAAILAAATSAPARYWRLPHLGSIEPGRAASLLVLDADPLVDPLTLARPSAVYLRGVRVDR